MPKPINNVFDIINNIAFDSDPVDINIADRNLYSPYITNRYLTFVNSKTAHLVNDTVNKYGLVYNPLEHYNFLFHLIPKTKRKFIRYAKKKKKSENNFERVSKKYNLSSREIRLYSEQFDVNIPKYE